MAPSEIDFYKILGLGRHSTDDDIKRSFRKLARDTHPDKNPNDPTAKERFQDLQQAYDTLRDQLERSKYDEDNPYHGLERSARATNTGRSGTAKRYTAAGTAPPTPGWATGTTRHEGFAQKAASGKPKTRSHEYYHTPWESMGQTTSGFSYETGGYRSSAKTAEYEDSYGAYRRKESAYAKTSSQHPYQSKHGGSTSPRPKSTSGTNPQSSTNARYSTPNPKPTPGGFNVADYIREKKAKEMAAEEEKRRQDEAREREERLKRDAEELKMQEEERSRKAKEHERRRAEEAARNPYTKGYASTNGYYGFSTDSNSYRSASQKEDDDLLKEVDERVKRSKSAKPNGFNYSNQHTPKPFAPTKPAPVWPKEHPLNAQYEKPEQWKYDRSHVEVEVVDVAPTPNFDNNDDSPRVDYFNVTPASYVREDGTGVYPVPHFSSKSPVKERTSHNRQNADKAHDSRSSSRKSRDTPSHQMSAKKDSDKNSDQKENRKPPNDVFTSQETKRSPKRGSPFAKPAEFCFTGSRPFGSFTSNNSPEPQTEKAGSTASDSYLRPRSQPSTPLGFAPPPSAPPNLQQQQQHQQRKSNTRAESRKNNRFERELYEDLLKQAGAFGLLPSDTGSTARKKRSVASLNKKKSYPFSRAASKEGRFSARQPKVESESETEDKKPSSPRPEIRRGTSLGYEPMDLEPDTRAPEPALPKSPLRPATANESGKAPAEKKKSLGLDMSNIAGVPPLSRSPEDVGLGGFETLKDSLPFPSQPSEKPPSNSGDLGRNTTPPNSAGKTLECIPTTNFLDMYPPTPAEEEPFIPPKAPPIPKVPHDVSLNAYNHFYESLGPYIKEWNKFEADVQSLRAKLANKSIHLPTQQTFDAQDIVKYMNRVKNKDMVLDRMFTKSRDRHMKSLDDWMKLREMVLASQEH